MLVCLAMYVVVGSCMLVVISVCCNCYGCCSLRIVSSIVCLCPYNGRVSALVNHMRASAKATAELRRMQVEIIREGNNAVSSDEEGVSASEVPSDESGEGGRRPNLRRVLQLVRSMDTRWNSTFFMLQRAVRLRKAIDRWFGQHPEYENPIEIIE